MEPVIIITDDATDIRTDEIAEALRGMNLQEPSRGTMIDALELAGNDRRTTLICAASEMSANETASLAKDLDAGGTGVVLVCPAADPALLDPSELTLETLISSIMQGSFNFAPMLSAPSSLINEIPKDRLISRGALAIYMMIAALGNGEEISVISNNRAQTASGTILENAEIANLIRFAVAECNIEELYPNHAWKEHEEESLSSCYHSLAAIFIRLRDFDAALECLNISEQFEDSPRLLALRGIIAATQGRALEAVANMVSSLQQYEARKRNDGEHYLTFTPTDLETINTDLKEGLDALNRRDNEKAFEYFSKAIFNFDSFYREAGIAGLMRAV